MKQRLVKSWMLYSAVYSFVSTVFLFLFRRWIRYEIVETLRIQEILGTITLFLLLILFFGFVTAAAMLILNRQAERKIGEQLLMIQKAKHRLVKEEDSPNWIMEATVVDLNDFYEQTAALSERLEKLSLEVQQLGSKPQFLGTETKEQVIQEERRRIARELHDSVSQQLFAAMMMISALNERADKFDEKEQKQLKMIEHVLSQAQSEMRALLLHLRPISLESKSLKSGIEGLLIELQTKVQMKIHWDIEDVKLPEGVEDHLFRIAQELLSNTLRHSHATTLEVYLRQLDSTVLFKIEDNGVGFNSEEILPGSYGINNMKERVQGLGGQVRIVSFPNQGTTIEIKIPLSRHMEDEQ
ncbi:MAG: sensor histidine kinase [Streptococcus sp.]|jgi:sensor histidine kinase|uniref:sensor histidine kinase n=1 Tax=unclassified Granulicatella TaxID=2630493 RepID=UPI001CB5244D|nr:MULTISPECIES: sensor histidine kinase [unclassified Granulicatella]MBF1710702.1 sensor histidine kinase [Streptococcus sp.]MDK8380725.1 sensor histidine kinase [Granulicatella sp. UMB5615B]MDK8522669.1 sensor histidine kinase [Granulicatella sp. UMB5615A]